MSKTGELFGTFFKIGAFTFGGGYAMVALLEHEFVEKKRWLTREEFLDMVAIAESTPGPVAVNSATYIGYKLAGVAGAAACFCVVAAELAFENAVGTLHLLLFTQLRTVVRKALAGGLAVLAGLHLCALDLGVKGTAGALQIEVGTLAARELQLGTEISCHFICYLFYPAA